MTIQLRNFAQTEINTILQQWWEHPAYGGLLCDALIERFIKITPMHKGPCTTGTFSYGLGAYGYDIRLGTKFKVFTNVHSGVVDPKAVSPASFVDVELAHPAHNYVPCIGQTVVPGVMACDHCGEMKPAPEDPEKVCLYPRFCIIPPNSFALAEALEHIEVPREVLVLGIGKSSYARAGIILNVTPAEPEWRGRLTLEISNTTPLPVKVYAMEGICQLLFFKAPVECLVSYADKKGKYQDQPGLTLPFAAA